MVPNLTHLETELQLLKASVVEMWNMVINQIEKSKAALVHMDKDLATNIRITEKRVNSYELKIDRDCENILALYAPVAIDLRFVLAMLKINYNLERIGDYAGGIAQIIEELDKPFKEGQLSESQVLEMFDICVSIMKDTLTAFEKENVQLGRSIFKRDELLDKINDNSYFLIGEMIKKFPDYSHHCIGLFSIIRKLERAGDHTQNIAEELIFYVEAKVLKHNSKKKMEEEN
jgi:phosphate transport system protein